MSKKNEFKKSSLARRNLQKFISNKLAIFGIVMLLAMIILAFGAPLFTSHAPDFCDPSIRFQEPSSDHMLGTDAVGRDLWSRLLYGGRYSIVIGLFGALGASIIGIVLGCVGGYYGGIVDTIMLYISEIITSFPQLILVLIFVGFAGRGWMNLIIVFSVTGWTFGYRIVRSRIFSLREEAFVESCKANGIGGMSIMFRHILPNTLGPVMVNLTLMTAGYVLQEAGLSFIGLGVEAHIPTWGNIINAAKSMAVMTNYPMLWIAPGIAISLFVLGVNFFGDGLRDVYDPGQ